MDQPNFHPCMGRFLYNQSVQFLTAGYSLQCWSVCYGGEVSMLSEYKGLAGGFPISLPGQEATGNLPTRTPSYNKLTEVAVYTFFKRKTNSEKGWFHDDIFLQAGILCCLVILEVTFVLFTQKVVIPQIASVISCPQQSIGPFLVIWSKISAYGKASSDNWWYVLEWCHHFSVTR